MGPLLEETFVGEGTSLVVRVQLLPEDLTALLKALAQMNVVHPEEELASEVIHLANNLLLAIAET